MMPEAILLLAGGSVRLANGRQRSTTYNDSDAFGALGGRDRVEAAAILANRYPEAWIVTGSLYADELAELGIDRRRIIGEESLNTRDALEAFWGLAVERGWSHLTLVSSGFHLPRIRAFYDQVSHPGLMVEFIASEAVLKAVRPEFAAEFSLIEQTSAYKKRLVSEERGIEALRRGAYHPATARDKKER